MHFVEAKGILSAGNGMNLYRGCTHGCIYCDARSKCYQMHHDFEDIEVKQNGPQLLEAALRSKRKKCMIGTGAMCDPYMHCEEELRLTRRCLELIEEYGFGLAMRFEVLEILRDNGIPTVVWLSPILPLINDTRENLEGILDYCIRAKVYGIICFGMGMTLREGNREYYYQALEQHFPGLRQKYHQKYGYAYEVTSEANRELMRGLYDRCRQHGIKTDIKGLFAYLHEFPENKGYEQLSLFS